VLTAEQRAKVASEPAEPSAATNDVMVWQAVVALPPLTRVVRLAAPLDSAEVRLSVMPIYADIYLDGIKIGSGRRFVKLAIGAHTLLYHARDAPMSAFRSSWKKDRRCVPRQTLTCN